MKDPTIPAITQPQGVRAGAAPNAPVDAELIEKAREFESVFAAQMLSYSGLDKALSAESGFGGEAFSSLLVERFADQLVERGGFGLTEKIYEQLRERQAGNVDKTNS